MGRGDEVNFWRQIVMIVAIYLSLRTKIVRLFMKVKKDNEILTCFEFVCNCLYIGRWYLVIHNDVQKPFVVDVDVVPVRSVWQKSELNQSRSRNSQITFACSKMYRCLSTVRPVRSNHSEKLAPLIAPKTRPVTRAW